MTTLPVFSPIITAIYIHLWLYDIFSILNGNRWSGLVCICNKYCSRTSGPTHVRLHTHTLTHTHTHIHSNHLNALTVFYRIYAHMHKWRRLRDFSACQEQFPTPSFAQVSDHLYVRSSTLLSRSRSRVTQAYKCKLAKRLTGGCANVRHKHYTNTHRAKHEENMSCSLWTNLRNGI